MEFDAVSIVDVWLGPVLLLSPVLGRDVALVFGMPPMVPSVPSVPFGP